MPQSTSTAKQAAVPLPGDCDLLDVPLGAGLLALARMDLRGRATGAAWALAGAADGPEGAEAGGRLLLPLPVGVAAELPALLRWLGWAHLDGVLRGHEAGRLPSARRLREGRSPGPLPPPRLVDACADACARTQLAGLPRPADPWPTVPAQRQARISCAPSRTPRGCCSAPGRAR